MEAANVWVRRMAPQERPSVLDVSGRTLRGAWSRSALTAGVTFLT